MAFPALEKDLLSRVGELMSQPAVKGVLIADGNGLCLIAQGDLQAKSSGYLASVALRAQELVGSEAEAPTVCVESDTCNIYVRKEGALIVAVMKTAHAA
eukprot:EC718858.1.p1 GENE.EC718858.1~~EC718858.1.p1  ORF type:complete len:107 (+),score=4.24 EC718858.1:25-321(+)